MKPRRGNKIIELVGSGFVEHGELLRYKKPDGTLLMVGRARQKGIFVPEQLLPMTLTQMEIHSGSKRRQPNTNTFNMKGRSMAQLYTEQEAQLASTVGPLLPPATRAHQPAVPLLEDDNDEYCHVCCLGGDLVCCETCPATFHTACIGLPALPDNDWFCPLCCCASCGQAGFEAFTEVGSNKSSIIPVPCSSYKPLPLSGNLLLGCRRNKNKSGPKKVDIALCGFGNGTVSANGEVNGDLLSAPSLGSHLSLEQTAAAPPATYQQQLTQELGSPSSPMKFVSLNDAKTRMSSPVAPVAPTPPVSHIPRSKTPSKKVHEVDFSAMKHLMEVDMEDPADLLHEANGNGTVTAEDHNGLMEVRCAVSGRRRHEKCIANFSPGKPWFESSAAAAQSRQLAMACAAGAIPLGPGDDALQMQIIRGAAVAGSSCSGYTPVYTPEQQQQLRAVLTSALRVLYSCYEPLYDSRTGLDMLPWLIRGTSFPATTTDFNSMHTAVLFAGRTVLAVACFRPFGVELAEVPVLACRPELRHQGLGRLLLASVEKVLLQCGVQTVVTPAFIALGTPLVMPNMPPGFQASAVAQARWGYHPATLPLLHLSCKYPIVRIPGVALATKPLKEGSVVLPPCPAPTIHTLRLNPAADRRVLLRDRMLELKGGPLTGAASGVDLSTVTASGSDMLDQRVFGTGTKSAGGRGKGGAKPKQQQQQQKDIDGLNDGDFSFPKKREKKKTPVKRVRDTMPAPEGVPMSNGNCIMNGPGYRVVVGGEHGNAVERPPKEQRVNPDGLVVNGKGSLASQSLPSNLVGFVNNSTQMQAQQILQQQQQRQQQVYEQLSQAQRLYLAQQQQQAQQQQLEAYNQAVIQQHLQAQHLQAQHLQAQQQQQTQQPHVVQVQLQSHQPVVITTATAAPAEDGQAGLISSTAVQEYMAIQAMRVREQALMLQQQARVQAQERQLRELQEQQAQRERELVTVLQQQHREQQARHESERRMLLLQAQQLGLQAAARQEQQYQQQQLLHAAQQQQVQQHQGQQAQVYYQQQQQQAQPQQQQPTSQAQYQHQHLQQPLGDDYYDNEPIVELPFATPSAAGQPTPPLPLEQPAGAGMGLDDGQTGSLANKVLHWSTDMNQNRQQ